jgi:hypothetical protein
MTLLKLSYLTVKELDEDSVAVGDDIEICPPDQEI